MTNHAHAQAHAGSSLFQARNTHGHHHLHSHQHVHDQLKRDSDNNHNNHIRFSDNEILAERNPADFDPVVVVETISVVQIIDGSGAVIEVSTILSDAAGPPATQANPTAATVDSGAAVSLGLSLSLDLGTPTPSATAAVSDSSPSATDTADTVHVTNTSSSSLSDEATLTSTLLHSSTGLPSLPPTINSTTSSALFTNNTLFRTLFANSTTTFGSSSTLFSSSTDTFLSSVTSDAFSSGSTDVVTVIATETATGGQGGDAAASPTVDGTSATSTVATTSTGLPKETQNAVIGGVVGGLAGMALIVFLAMIVLRWKRQQNNGITRLRDRSSSVTGRALPPAPSGGGNDTSVATTQGSAPFMMPSALATLTGYKKTSQAGASAGQSTGEKGFYRVSGKKLMPVLQSGGDGYSDPHPRDSHVTNLSFYRDSQGYYGGSGTLQLGSPMRPESGVPIMRSGPGRTPMQEQGPFSDHAHPLTPPPLDPPAVDPLDRSLISQDGSRGSGSRFTEEI